MKLNSIAGRDTPFARLRQLASARPAREQCELCCAQLGPEHRHLLETATRKIVCACDACSLRFPPGLESRFKLIPRDSFVLSDFQLTDVQWAEFAIPINLAFLLRESNGGKITALYPGPAGVTESQVSPASWEALCADNSALEKMEPDVHILLVNRVGAKHGYYLAPIDAGFELAGILRLHWRGLSGGDEVWRHIGEFFARLEERSTSLAGTREEAHACD